MPPKKKPLIKNGYLADNEKESSVKTLKQPTDPVDHLAEIFQNKNKITTLQDGIDAFAKHLMNASQLRVSRNLTEINRRLDSLARLLEQGSTCAAVYFCQEINAILVATNTIH